MALATTVKISSVTNLSDARYCAGMGVDYLGFSMDEIPVEKFNDIRGWVAGVQIVGETISMDVATIAELIQQYQPDLLQVSNYLLIPALKIHRLPLLLRLDFFTLSISELEQILKTYQHDVKYFLLENSDDFAHLENETLDIIDRFATRFPILLSFGLKESNVKEVVEGTAIEGIALQGGEELRPGYKDFGEMMDILEALEDE